MAHVVKTKVGERITVSPVKSGSADVARANWKRDKAKEGADYQNAKNGTMVRFMDSGQLVTVMWVDV